MLQCSKWIKILTFLKANELHFNETVNPRHFLNLLLATNDISSHLDNYKEKLHTIYVHEAHVNAQITVIGLYLTS
jgi:hypothetical protein